KARELARRAEALLETNGGTPELRLQVAGWVTDFDMAIRLEEIRLLKADIEKVDEQSRKNFPAVEGPLPIIAGIHFLSPCQFDFARAQQKYRAAFDDYGIRVEALEPEETAKRIQSRSIAVELLTALDDWTYLRRYHLKQVGWEHLAAIARLADDDDWRNQVRHVLEREEWPAVAVLAK